MHDLLVFETWCNVHVTGHVHGDFWFILLQYHIYRILSIFF